MKLIFKNIAAQELESAISYYDTIDSNLANRFESEIWKYLDSIESNEELFQLRYRIVRIAPLKKFPYSIHYYIENGEVIILSIKHQSQYYK